MSGATANRLDRRLSALSAAGRKALVSFVTAGDPGRDATVPALHALVRGGTDVLELGMPFSDPEAEGPAIQASYERALANGMTLAGSLELVREFRRDDADTPVVLMGYLNSVLAMGEGRFAESAAAAGVDGLIIVNLPPEEAGPLKAALNGQGIHLILLVAPTTTEARARLIVEHSGGFVYYVSLKGITGADHLNAAEVDQKVRWLSGLTDLPVMVGFGIKDGASARAVAAHAAGAVVGSVLVRAMAEAGTPEAIATELEARAREIRGGLDSLSA